MKKSIPASLRKTGQTTIVLPDLAKGETYAGILITDGKPSHHVILLPGDLARTTWKEAATWAKKQGGELPTRREQSLLFANAQDAFKKEWYWSSEQYASNPSYAWIQSFDAGSQCHYRQDGSNRARAVRRLKI